jgi:hypothetical protein
MPAAKVASQMSVEAMAEMFQVRAAVNGFALVARSGVRQVEYLVNDGRRRVIE